jgi:cytosine/adenosine deaminase-related metal-dependent hydrolase
MFWGCPNDRLGLQDIGTLATFNKELGELQDAAVYVSGNIIKWVGATKDLPPQYSTADSVISLPDRVMIPGLVNSHHHMFQCLTRCIAQVWLGGCACMQDAA